MDRKIAATRSAAEAGAAQPLRPHPGPRGSRTVRPPRIPHLAPDAAPRFLGPLSPEPKKGQSKRDFGTLLPKDSGRHAFGFHTLSHTLCPHPSPVHRPLQATPEPRPGSRRLLDRNPVPAWPRLGFGQEMRCFRSTSLLRNSSAGVFLRYPASHPQL